MTARRAVNTNRQGAGFELMIMDDLDAHGFSTLRSSGSRGVADVIAFGPGDGDVETLLIQAKISDATIPPAERESLWNLARRAGCVPVTASRVNGKPLYRELTGTGPKEWVPFTPRRFCGAVLRGLRGDAPAVCDLPPRHRGNHEAGEYWWGNFHPGEDDLKYRIAKV